MSKFSLSLRSALLISSMGLYLGGVYAQTADVEAETDDDRLDTVVVRGEYIPNEKRATSEISSLINADDFQVQGDSDVASALARVTGLSVSRGKYVFVRGLNERYSNATLNGAPLPSPEPLRRVVPLDLFPTSVLDSVLVQKTYSAEYSAEFGGGTLEMRTVSVPDEPFFNISLSAGGDTETSLQDGLLYQGGDSDWTGFDDGTRDVPPILASIYSTSRVNDLPTSDRIRAGQELVDTPLWVQQEGRVGLNGGFSVSGGHRFEPSNNLSVGVVGTFSFDNSWDTKIGENKRYTANVRDSNNTTATLGDPGTTVTLNLEDDLRRISTENNIRLSSLVSVGADIGENHEVVGTAFLTRSTTKEARSLIGRVDERNDVTDADGRFDTLEWFEREVLTGQLYGEHTFPQLGNIWGDLDDFKLAWRASTSTASRDAPYERFVAYADTSGVTGDFDGTFQLAGPSQNATNFSTIDDELNYVAIDAELPLDILEREVDLSGGWSYRESDRDSFVKRYQFAGSFASAPEFQGARADVAFGDSTPLILREIGGTEFPEAFAGHIELDAYYGKADIELTPYLRVALGVRYEDSLQTSDTFNRTLGTDNGIIEAAISSQYGLPSVTATWNFTDNMQLRAGFSQTITRPQFRELAYQEFVDSETDRSFFGNPFLVNTEIKNYDARWEYYFAQDEFVTFGIFHKELDNPIEAIVTASGSSSRDTFINAPSATLTGFEAEFEKVIPVQNWLEWGWLEDKDIIARANYAYSSSEVSADGTIIRPSGSPTSLTRDERDASGFIIDGRKLQGQADHIVNFQIGYDNLNNDARFRLLVNWVSERIRRVEDRTRNTPAILEQLPISVDATYRRGLNLFGGDYEVSLKLQNIFGDDYEAYHESSNGDGIVDSYARGQKFSIGISRDF